jgi:DNA-binding NtrC family response regulator
MAQKKVSALLLYERPDPVGILKAALAAHPVNIRVVRSCREAMRTISGRKPPELIFTDAHLADGTWSDVVASANRAQSAVNVIVVSPAVDMKLHIEAIEQGAFDFIAPPFDPPALAHILRCAAHNVEDRRQSRTVAPTNRSGAA